MSKLICPFCGDELAMDYTGVMYCCNVNCESSADWYGSKILWQELIRTKKQLEVYHEFITKLYLNGNITDEQLERVKRKLSKVLEQKDVK